jgi:hypothetical protein
MPTKKPRLTITLSEPLAWQLQKLSQLTGQSQGGLIASLLEGSDLILQRMIIVLEAAQEARDEMPGRLTQEMSLAQERIERHFGLLQAVDSSVKRRARKSAQRGPVLGDAGHPSALAANESIESIRERVDAALSRVPNPLSNRGVRSKAKVAKKPTESRG